MPLQSFVGDTASEFILLVADTCAEVPVLQYLTQLFRNERSLQLHILSLASEFDVSSSNVSDTAPVTLHDFRSCPMPSLAETLTHYKKSMNPNIRNVMIIDNFQLFLINAGKDYGRLVYFFKSLTKTCQVYAVINKEVCSADDLRFSYGLADNVATINRDPSFDTKFICNILTSKSSGKLIHNQSTLSFENGQLCETQKSVDSGAAASQRQNQNRDLASLTTFKLTVEDDEKETKRNLHLPYFNAQFDNPTGPEPIAFDDDDDEEDDEEI